MISVIIPALDEERALPGALAGVLAQPGTSEIIVVDGGSRDRTRAIARSTPGVRLLQARRGRAAQMNAGAAAAKGEWLVFLHADTLLPERAFERIAALPATTGAGCFRQAFGARHPLLAVVSALHNLRCRATLIMYGDQAMFVRRGLFRALGGFPDVVHLEDVLLSERIRAVTRPVLLDATVTTDARKFLVHGVIRSLARIVLILVCHRLGLRLRGLRFFEPVR
jgi:rSAM/selenodomain-associated transferase 2